MFGGRTALVTGAGSGIGRAISLAFAREGASVLAVDISSAGAAETGRLIAEDGGTAHALAADIADAESVQSLFVEAFSIVGTLDFAVNNAGVSQHAAATADIDIVEWNRVIGINLTGTWLCMREELRHMTKRKAGAIVNIASIAALRTLPDLSAYVASKHGVAGLTRNAALEYAAEGIRINAVCPGSVPTAMFESHVGKLSPEAREEALAAAGSRHPMGRVGSAQEIADMVLFLCSSRSSFVTGQCIAVDGGRSIA